MGRLGSSWEKETGILRDIYGVYINKLIYIYIMCVCACRINNPINW